MDWLHLMEYYKIIFEQKTILASTHKDLDKTDSIAFKLSTRSEILC